MKALKAKHFILFTVLTLLTATLFISGKESLAAQTQNKDKVTLILDWYLNPNHAPLIVAQEFGAFDKYNLDVDIVTPSDPSIGARMVAANQADLTLSYHQYLNMFAEQKLPLWRVGTMIDTPLNSIIALPDSGIKTPGDLENKKIGSATNSSEKAILRTVMAHEGADSDKTTIINVGFNLVSGLLSKQVDAITGAYRNIEGPEIRALGIEPVIMNIEDYGIPVYDESIFIANKNHTDTDKLKRFFQALKEAIAYLKAHPQETWEAFAKAHPDLGNDVNKNIWFATVQYFANDPAKLDRQRYENYAKFLYDNKVITNDYPVDSYATELK